MADSNDVYTVQFTPAALRNWKKLSPDQQQRIAGTVDDLSANPRPSGYKKLVGRAPAIHRVRSGDFRVLYTINDSSRVISIARILARDKAY